MAARLSVLTAAGILPLRGVTMRFEPFIAGLDIESDEAASVDHGREKPSSAPSINRTRVNSIPLSDL
jgi:hypothetical protein